MAQSVLAKFQHPDVDIDEVLKTRAWDWDKGVFASELVRQKIFPRHISSKATTPFKNRLHAPPPLSTGTLRGTRIAASELYRRIENRFGSFYDIANFESSIPQDLSLKLKRNLYTFQVPGSDNYPPHLAVIPPNDQTGLLEIFDAMRLADTGTLFLTIIPDVILNWIHDEPGGDTIAKIEERNNTLHAEQKDIFAEPNIGHRRDWYTDAVFAQQQFTGPNPTTIAKASLDWVQQFQQAAKAQTNAAMSTLLDAARTNGSLYIQDCSFFRKSANASPTASLSSSDGTRFACAAVTLFQLSADGKLHPLAIILDYKASIDNSIVIFNKRLHSTDPTALEATDWPWRYAKTCAQVSDWMRHEVMIHLVNTHFVEEVVIVATHRSFDTSHIVFRLLEPHWLKTLSLNASARAALVPSVISKIIGLTDDQLYTFTKAAYSNFDWTGLYIPTDLANRGFPPEEVLTNPKFHNYVYGKNILLMWQVLRTFVTSVLATVYTSDHQVANDSSVATWCEEMRNPNGGAMSSFPIIKTIDGLVDAVVMCIHIASPQHTAVNYLQQYYQSFVISKPAALCAPLPANLKALQAVKEKDIIEAIPADRPREWLLASHLPWLLSVRVAEDQNLINFALSVASLASQNNEPGILSAATTLYSQLMELITVFKKNSEAMDDQTTPYEVMDPEYTAVSILI